MPYVVLAASRGFKATWLPEPILMYFSGLMSMRISYTQAKITYVSAWKTIAYFPIEMLSLLLKDCP
jgi:hypothetical protein